MSSSGNDVFVQTARKDAVLVLPHLRRIIHMALAADGYTLREPALLRYRPFFDAAEVTVEIVAPFQGLLRGNWTDHHPYQMRFRFIELQCSFARGAAFPLVPAPPAAGLVLEVGEITIPAASEEPPRREHRVINLE
jgi:hypothetical protein